MWKARIRQYFKLLMALGLGLGIFLIIVGLLLGLPKTNASAFILKSQEMPQYNWSIAEDLGVGQVPGLDPAQIFVVSHPQGWEVLAYCLEPGEESPPVGTTCELLDGDTFWCGDAYQNIRQFQVRQTPPPQSTSTATSTLTSTPTSTSLPPTIDPTNDPHETPTPRPNMGSSSNNVSSGDLLLFGLGLSLFAFGILFLVINWRRIFFRSS